MPSVDPSEVKLVPGMPGKIAQESESPKPRSDAAVVQGTVDTSGDGKTPEQRQVGNMSDAVRQEYAKAVVYGWVALCVTVTLLAYVVMGFNDRWLGVYVKSDSDDDTDMFIIVYIVGTVLFLVMLITSSSLVQTGGARAARALHGECISSLLHAPLGIRLTLRRPR